MTTIYKQPCWHRSHSSSIGRGTNFDPRPERYWEFPLKYWNCTAVANPAVQILSDRQQIALPTAEPESFTRLKTPIRRLVITGEDRPANFRRLSRPYWDEAEGVLMEERKRIRLAALRESER